MGADVPEVGELWVGDAFAVEVAGVQAAGSWKSYRLSEVGVWILDNAAVAGDTDELDQVLGIKTLKKLIVLLFSGVAGKTFPPSGSRSLTPSG